MNEKMYIINKKIKFKIQKIKLKNIIINNFNGNDKFELISKLDTIQTNNDLNKLIKHLI